MAIHGKSIALLLLLAMTTVQFIQQASAIPSQESAPSQQQVLSAVPGQDLATKQLYSLLGQELGDTVLTAVSERRQRQQQQQTETPSISEPDCERQPEPLPFQDAYTEPKKRACAYSCLQLRNVGDSPQDGVYWFTNMTVPVLCDFSHDGGGWTLLLTAVTKSWDLLSAKSRRQGSPSLTEDYSILRYGDDIRDLGKGGRFAYRIEAQAETGRQRLGGIWLAPRHYSFVHETEDQTEVRLVRRFDVWGYKDRGIEQRMPWLRAEGGDNTVLTTSTKYGRHWWGTLASHARAAGGFKHSPWIDEQATHSGTVLYWMREEEL